MTPRLPTCKAREVLEALKKAGWYIYHVDGSHHQLRHDAKPGKTLTIPIHPGDLPRPVLQRILKKAELSDEAFLRLL